jgi:hypothetical protein
MATSLPTCLLDVADHGVRRAFANPPAIGQIDAAHARRRGERDEAGAVRDGAWPAGGRCATVARRSVFLKQLDDALALGRLVGER